MNSTESVRIWRVLTHEQSVFGPRLALEAFIGEALFQRGVQLGTFGRQPGAGEPTELLRKADSTAWLRLRKRRSETRVSTRSSSSASMARAASVFRHR